MSTLRAAVTFLILVIIVVLAMFQMQIRGYDKVARVGGFVLYVDTDLDCENAEIKDDGITYDVICSSQYLLKSGFSEYSIVEAIDEGYITIDDLNGVISIVNE